MIRGGCCVARRRSAGRRRHTGGQHPQRQRQWADRGARPHAACLDRRQRRWRRCARYCRLLMLLMLPLLTLLPLLKPVGSLSRCPSLHLWWCLCLASSLLLPCPSWP